MRITDTSTGRVRVAQSDELPVRTSRWATWMACKPHQSVSAATAHRKITAQAKVPSTLHITSLHDEERAGRAPANVWHWILGRLRYDLWRAARLDAIGVQLVADPRS